MFNAKVVNQQSIVIASESAHIRVHAPYANHKSKRCAMRANYYGKPQSDSGDYLNRSLGYHQLRQVPFQSSRDAITYDNDGRLLCKGAVPRQPGLFRIFKQVQQSTNTSLVHWVVKAQTKKRLTDLAMATSEYTKWDLFNVYLDLSEKGLGMSIRGGNDSPDKHGNIDVYVSRILAGGAVHQDGRLQIGKTCTDIK